MTNKFYLIRKLVYIDQCADSQSFSRSLD